MESKLVLTTLATLVLPLTVIFFIVKNWVKSVDLAPGPKKLPLIGNLHLIYQPMFRCFRDLSKQYGPIMHVKMGEVDAIVVSSAETAKQVVKDQDSLFCNRFGNVAIQILLNNYFDITFCPYGGYWRQMRKICIMELLSTKNVGAFSSIREDEVSRLLESIRASVGKPVNLTEKVFASASSIICRAAFSEICKDKESLIRLVRDFLDVGAGFLVADSFPSSKIANVFSWVSKMRLLRMQRNMDVILDELISHHKTNRAKMEMDSGGEDLVDVLLRIKEGGELEFPIEYGNIKAVLLDMFIGGTETSSSTIDWAMAELVRNPRVMAKAQAEVRQVMKGKRSIEEEDIEKMKYLKLVIMETQRLHPQGSIITRYSKEARSISGYTIPEKVMVMINVWAIQRDPEYWVDPETFEPERFQDQPSFDLAGTDFRYMPFGSGRRVCPGITFGMVTVALHLAQLLYTFNWKLPEGVDVQDLNMIENYGITTCRKEKLFLVPLSYEPSTA